MSQPFNQLTPAQVERLALLSEECGEVIQAIGKILRHGYGSRNPLMGLGPLNREVLERELGDVMTAMDLLCCAGDLDSNVVEAARKEKRILVQRYLHHQDDARKLPH